ncbi:MAG: hypothetical protein MRY83_13055, partial [Flavobacteriales bacterium]|nr:hypothetical protein [Flavobacteriales bacterium]
MQKFSAFLFLLLSACQAPVQRTKGELIRDVKTIHLRFVLSPGKDLAQNLGTIFELRNDSGLHLAAGFQNNSQTYATSNNRILSLFCHDTLALTTKDLGRPFSEFYNGNKLFNINNQLITVNINKPYEPKKYNELSKSWEVDTVLSKLGDIYNLQIVNNQILAFLRNSIQFGSNEIFRLDDCYYLSSIYRNGSFLIFAHLINGKNQILFADWSPGDSLVIVKKYTLDSYSPEYNFPYAILDVDETHFLVGTNIGKVYLVSRDSLIEVHSRTKNEISWQPYSFLNYYNQTLIGQFPSGYLFTYNNSKIKPFYPKVEPQYWNNNHQREAQGLSLYSGKIITGVWPWGEVYSYHHD